MDGITKSICKMIGLAANIQGFSQIKVEMLANMLDAKLLDEHPRYILNNLISIACFKQGSIEHDFIVEGKNLAALLKDDLLNYQDADVDEFAPGALAAELAMLDSIINSTKLVQDAQDALKLLSYPEDISVYDEESLEHARPGFPTPAGYISVYPQRSAHTRKANWHVELTPYGSDATFFCFFMAKREAMSFARFLISRATPGWAPQISQDNLQRLRAENFDYALTLCDLDLPQDMLGYCSHGYNANTDEDWYSIVLVKYGSVLAEAFRGSSKENDFTLLSPNDQYSKDQLSELVDKVWAAVEYDTAICFVS